MRVQILAGAAGQFSSPESTLCADSHSVSVPPPVLQQWHLKDPGHSAKSAGGRLHLNIHTPLTQQSRSGLTVPLSWHNVSGKRAHTQLIRNTWSQSYQLAEPLWTDPCLSEVSVGKLISTLKRKKKKKMQMGNELSNILPKSPINK